jgi:hypothetical protein
MEMSSLRLIDMDDNVVRVIRKVGSACSYICSREDDIACVIQGMGDAKVIDIATGNVLATRSLGRVLSFGRAVPSGLDKLLYFRLWKFEIITIGD